MSKYWVDVPSGCPIGGPFDVWRKNYFLATGKPPEDTQKMYPALSVMTVASIAKSVVTGEAELDEVLDAFSDKGPEDQLSMAYEYFREWRKHAPFMHESWQDIPLRPARTSPEPLEEFMEDFNHRVLLTLDDDSPISHNGIKQLNALD